MATANRVPPALARLEERYRFDKSMGYGLVEAVARHLQASGPEDHNEALAFLLAAVANKDAPWWGVALEALVWAREREAAPALVTLLQTRPNDRDYRTRLIMTLMRLGASEYVELFTTFVREALAANEPRAVAALALLFPLAADSAVGFGGVFFARALTGGKSDKVVDESADSLIRGLHKAPSGAARSLIEATNQRDQKAARQLALILRSTLIKSFVVESIGENDVQRLKRELEVGLDTAGRTT